MLNNDILDALKAHTATMKNDVTLVLPANQDENHSKRAELLAFLTAVAAVSPRLHLETSSNHRLRSPVSFSLKTEQGDSGIVFSGIPGGHEFTSLALAILQLGGSTLRLDDTLQKMVRNISESLHFEVFVSLSCHNCPDVVQTLNQFAQLNPNIGSEMIDGGLFPDLVRERDIQGVPSVYLNGELFANGKVTAMDLFDKISQRYPNILSLHTKESMPLQDIVVIGGGPAGVSAAVYGARKGLDVTIVADRIGGQVKDTMGIENLISVPQTTGPELSGALQNHLNQYPITVKEHLRVNSIEDHHGIKSIILSSGEKIQTKSIILATGAKWRELGVPGEKENVGNGVAYCPHCDGPFFKNKDVAVVGGGNSGIEAALDLSGIVKSVTVFEFMPTFKADSVLLDQARARDNITLLNNVAVNSIVADGSKVNALNYQDRASSKMHQQALDGVFVQIGLLPNTEFVKDLVQCNAQGEIVIDQHCNTSVPGIFACGDATTVPFKQIIVSMGEGAKAALSAFDYLLKEHITDEGQRKAG